MVAFCGVGAGRAHARQAGHPFDTIKVRLQTDNIGRFRGPWHCLVETVRGEGLRALYKGVTPPLLATGVINSLMFGMQVQSLCACMSFLLAHDGHG